MTKCQLDNNLDDSARTLRIVDFPESPDPSSRTLTWLSNFAFVYGIVGSQTQMVTIIHSPPSTPSQQPYSVLSAQDPLAVLRHMLPYPATGMFLDGTKARKIIERKERKSSVQNEGDVVGEDQRGEKRNTAAA